VQFVAGGGGARGGARGGSDGADSAVGARDGGRWRQFGAREVAVDRRTTLGGGDWTRRSPEWASNGEAPATEEENGSLVGLYWFRYGVLGDADGALSRRNPGRHRGKRCGTALLFDYGSSKRGGGAGESKRAGKGRGERLHFINGPQR
jgi:hypothetical protein